MTPRAAADRLRRRHRFVFYGDCCSGVPGAPCATNFARVNASLKRAKPKPEFILFLGDHIMGAVSDAAELRRQWRHWLDVEMAWLDRQTVPLYHVTSNHNTFDALSERVWRDVFPEIPRNGPRAQSGLSYWVRRGDLLLVVVNTSFSGLGGSGHVECAWLERVLREHPDARHRIVAGHYPMFPVNGYVDRPQWCVAAKEARAFWSVLVRHGVLAYLCSHVIAFDIQSHDGVLQVCSGGAGTNYGPGGFMGPGEYFHFVQVELDAKALRLRTIDVDGRVRERLTWKIDDTITPRATSCRRAGRPAG